VSVKSFITLATGKELEMTSTEETPTIPTIPTIPDPEVKLPTLSDESIVQVPMLDECFALSLPMKQIKLECLSPRRILSHPIRE